MKKRCFALLLALSLLLTGCSPLFDLYSAARGEYTRPDYSDGAILVPRVPSGRISPA